MCQLSAENAKITMNIRERPKILLSADEPHVAERSRDQTVSRENSANGWCSNLAKRYSRFLVTMTTFIV